jgi:hypothetical protein
MEIFFTKIPKDFRKKVASFFSPLKDLKRKMTTPLDPMGKQHQGTNPSKGRALAADR